MLEFLFTILMFVVFGKILIFAFRATWGISKILFSVVLLPLFLIILVVSGLITLALPILIVVGIVSLVTMHD